ncbi:hypothetical protein GT347_24695 [Xylophilus rhododendri]|uniref:Uncharacterized protein n=1 Tax=Xylophilus rhododendri TaxID=2697032 RepID=A0A857JA87_9BURK|nr:hypothetical protein [Xylophilus rhododendri]QHJ00905.1 hypothetical protein GT347_24695 [Xylophilus rhododendri]
MSLVSSVIGQNSQAVWNTVRDTVRGAANGDVGDIAKVAVGVAIATGAVPVSNGVAALAGGAVAGRLLDVFV